MPRVRDYKSGGKGMKKPKYFLLLIFLGSILNSFAVTAVCSNEQPVRNYPCCSYTDVYGRVNSRWILAFNCPMHWVPGETCKENTLLYLGDASRIDFSPSPSDRDISQYCRSKNNSTAVISAVQKPMEYIATCFNDSTQLYACCMHKDVYGIVSKSVWLEKSSSCPVHLKWSIARNCRANSLMYAGDLSKVDLSPNPYETDISQYCWNNTKSKGIVLDGKVTRICTFSRTMSNGINRTFTKPQTFIAWTYHEGKDLLYASRSNTDIAETAYNRVIPSSSVKLWTRTTSSYGWINAEKDEYKISRNVSDDKWTVEKNGHLLSDSATCM
ncbi:MAG: hypothetical protein K0R14_844 [Burkholderiales bacterium]|jgi:hypothetical protein|nr:hypothetical protein [Burkholderiales bacterium]